MSAQAMALPEDPPPICDHNGYRISCSDLQFLNIEIGSLRDMKEGIRPLGMSLEDYSWFVEDLQYALVRDGITEADIRLQGSSANLWSGPHKKMPYEREKIADILSTRQRDWPEKCQIDECYAILQNQWPDPEYRPVRRPFDVMFRTKLDEDPSDYDIQLSSDQMIGRIKIEAQRRGLDPKQLKVKNPDYGFIEKKYCLPAFKYVQSWSERATARLGRPVTWVVFPSDGPEENVKDALLSSHFKDTDWKISHDTQRTKDDGRTVGQ